MSASIALYAVLLPQLVDSTDRVKKPVPEKSAEITHEKRGDIFMARKMYREASETYRLALGDQPKNARLHNKLGISFHQQLQFARARDSYLRASKIDKAYAQAINNLGTVYYAQRRYRRAQKSYQQALKLSPRSASIYSNLGTAYFARSKFKQASHTYLKALELDPRVFERKSGQGTMLEERSVQNRGKYYFFLAEAYAKSANYDRALFYLTRSLEEGYGSRRKIIADKTFKPMYEIPEFQRLVDPEGEILAQAD